MKNMAKVYQKIKTELIDWGHLRALRNFAWIMNLKNNENNKSANSEKDVAPKWTKAIKGWNLFCFEKVPHSQP